MKKNTALKAGATALAALGMGFGVAACGSSTAPGIATVPGDGATVEAVTSTTATSTTATTKVKTPTTGALSKAPADAAAVTTSVTKLVSKDLITGTGATAATGDDVYVNYVGEVAKTGKVFQSSFTDGDGVFGPVQLGEGEVIKGWDEGIVGMKVGGRRELIIPSSLAYGATGDSSAGIGKNQPLIFIIDLLKVTKG